MDTSGSLIDSATLEQEKKRNGKIDGHKYDVRMDQQPISVMMLSRDL
jgi:hypothetical protein